MAEYAGSTSVSDPYGSPDHPPADELNLVLDAVQGVQAFHDAWTRKIEKRYRAYRGIAEKRQQTTPSWRSNLTTPYILQVVEGMLSTILDPKPKWEVEPRPLPGEPLEEILARRQTGKVASAALQYAMDEDGFSLKQRPFVQQDLIAGITVAKGVWAYEARDMMRLRPIDIEVTDDFGTVHDRYTSTEEEEQLTVMRDGPSMVVRDVRDFFWPEGAKGVDDAKWIIDRNWLTYDELMQKQAAGFYKNCEELKEARNEQATYDYDDREQLLWAQRRNANLIEVLEYWTDDKMITVGGRSVVLDSRPNPFRIKRKPFVVCSGLPDAFQMVGISVVESLAQLQEYLWTLQNQRIDALRLLTNVISIIRSDVDDPDSFEFYPGAQWIVEDPSQVSQLQFDPTAAQITLEAESLIKGDLQNMMGGLPFAGGTDSSMAQGAGAGTATGMSIVTSIAQKMIQSRKQSYMWGFSQMGELFLGMMGQMLREERTISMVGAKGRELMQVHPLDLQGDFDCTINVMDESTIREQKRSEAMALMNLVAAVGPAMGMDMKPVMEMVLESYGVQNTDQFFPPPAAPPPGAPPPPGGTPPGAAGIQEGMDPSGNPIGSQGQTNPGLAAAMGGGAGQAGLSLSPDQFAQQQIQSAQQMGMGAQG